MNSMACRIILKTVETRSLTKTADYFHYTQARVSQIIKGAEKYLHVLLFSRTAGGVVATEGCMQLLPYFRQVIEAEDALLAQAEQLQTGKSGVIRVGSFSSLSCHWLPERIRSFETIFTTVKFEVKMGDQGQIAQWVQSGAVDIGFAEAHHAADMNFVKLLEDAYVLVLPPDHPLARRKSVALEELSAEKLILLEPEDNTVLDMVLRQLKNPPIVHYRVKDDYTILSMVENHLGISILPSLLLHRTMYHVVTVPVAPRIGRNLGFLYSTKRDRSRQIEEFMNFMSRELVDGEMAPGK